MDPIKEALTFDDVTLVPKYSEILPRNVNLLFTPLNFLNAFLKL